MTDRPAILNAPEAYALRIPKPPFLTFSFDGETVGKFLIADSVLTFEGNADASAKVFIEHVVSNYDTHTVALKARIKELEAANKALHTAQSYTYVGRDGKAVLARDLEARAEAAEARAAELEARLAEAVKVIEPFAGAASSYDPPEGDDEAVAWAHDFKIGHLRAARAFMEGK